MSYPIVEHVVEIPDDGVHPRVLYSKMLNLAGQGRLDGYQFWHSHRVSRGHDYWMLGFRDSSSNIEDYHRVVPRNHDLLVVPTDGKDLDWFPTGREISDNSVLITHNLLLRSRMHAPSLSEPFEKGQSQFDDELRHRACEVAKKLENRLNNRL